MRDIAQLLASEELVEQDATQREKLLRRVMIVDTNNEIAGDHVTRHKAVGNARRIKVGDRSNQARIMLEAVQNHTPEVLIIDEIATREEVNQAIGVKQRGVQLIATTHGRTLADVIQNPYTRDLLGGVNTVTLSSFEKRAQKAEQKTRIERKMEPSFDVCIVLNELNIWTIIRDVPQAVDVILKRQGQVEVEVRKIVENDVISTKESFPKQPFNFQIPGNE